MLVLRRGKGQSLYLFPENGSAIKIQVTNVTGSIASLGFEAVDGGPVDVLLEEKMAEGYSKLKQLGQVLPDQCLNGKQLICYSLSLSTPRWHCVLLL